MKYELCPYPPSLFEARDIMRKADKPQVTDSICKHALSESAHAVLDSVPETDHYVLDGGSLLHMLKWNQGDTYGSIANAYASFTTRTYGAAIIVFDGYDGPSTKDNTYQRRKRNELPRIIDVKAERIFTGTKDQFLNTTSHKESMIRLISDKLRQHGCTVVQASGDADVDIVEAAVSSSMTKSTTVIGEDTDLLVLLLFKALYFRSDTSINVLRNVSGSDVSKLLLFAHAFTGCDTASRIYGMGKKPLIQKLIRADPVLVNCAVQFCKQNQSRTLQKCDREPLLH